MSPAAAYPDSSGHNSRATREGEVCVFPAASRQQQDKWPRHVIRYSIWPHVRPGLRALLFYPREPGTALHCLKLRSRAGTMESLSQVATGPGFAACCAADAVGYEVVESDVANRFHMSSLHTLLRK